MFVKKNQFVLITLLFLAISLTSTIVGAHADGVKRVKSNHSVSTTIDKLEHALSKKGMTIFKRIDHTAGGEKVGIDIRPTELLIFGNPKIGTKLMQCAQAAALDLPQKALAYKDESGQVWLLYNDPNYMAARHHIKNCEAVIKKFSNALANFTKVATQ
jgi:uncharacterized protein (DUF302 family)